MITSIVRIVIALVPLALAPVLTILIADGRLDLGGGEMDLVWVLVWTVWSVIYAISVLVLWWNDWSIGRSVVKSILGEPGCLLPGSRRSSGRIV
jgi:hypothetical protein